ncbi:hypothetical protein [Pseudarthrobacter sp. S9]
MSPCTRIHLTERGEQLADIAAAILALVIIPATGFTLCWVLIP